MADFNLELLAKYPFMHEAKKYVTSLNLSIHEMQTHPIYSGSFELGRKRAVDALNNNLNINPGDPITRELSILSFAVARILVNLTHNRNIMKRYAASEATHAHRFLKSEDENTLHQIKEELNLNIRDNKIHYTDYIRLTKDLTPTEPRWKLVNRSMDAGEVKLSETDSLTLLKEAVKEKIMTPLNVSKVPENFREAANQINNQFTGKPTEISIKELNTDALPPCISSIISSLESGTVSHNGMFVLGTCLLDMGLSVEDTLKIFSRYPKFNEEKTRYQLGYLTGEKSTTKYSCPTCARIKGYGLCVAECNVKHPLMYYRDRNKKK